MWIFTQFLTFVGRKTQIFDTWNLRCTDYCGRSSSGHSLGSSNPEIVRQMENVMVSKIYGIICGLFAATAAVLVVTGNFPAITAVVFGFIAFGLIFMGMMFVLPYTITHAAPAEAKLRVDQKQAPSFSRSAAQQSGQAHARLIHPMG